MTVGDVRQALEKCEVLFEPGHGISDVWDVLAFIPVLSRETLRNRAAGTLLAGFLVRAGGGIRGIDIDVHAGRLARLAFDGDFFLEDEPAPI